MPMILLPGKHVLDLSPPVDALAEVEATTHLLEQLTARATRPAVRLVQWHLGEYRARVVLAGPARRCWVVVLCVEN